MYSEVVWMEKVYIIDGLRTPVGSFLGSLKSLSAPKLGAAVIRSLRVDTGEFKDEYFEYTKQ
jgi:acetyl-CoA acetyltransferase